MVDLYNRRWIPDYIGQRPEDDPQYIAYMRQQGIQVGQQPLPTGQTQALAPQMTPTIDAHMIQVASIAEAEDYQLQPGASQMFYTADRMAFIIKEQGPGGYNLMIYDRRPPQPQPQPLDPAQYVTWDGLDARVDARLAQLLNAGQPQQTQKGAE